MKYAVFTTTTPEWSHEEVATNLAAQGWDGIEWGFKDFPAADVPTFRAGNRAVWPMTGLEENIERIREITAAAGLQYSSLGGYALAHERDDAERMLAATAALGAGQVRISVPHVRSGDYKTLMADTRADYAWIAERAESYGVKALIEVHHRLLSSSPSACMNILEGLNPAHVGIIHDLGNTVIEGQEDYLSAFQMMGDYLAHIHVKNVVWVANPAPEEDGSTRYHDEWATLREGIASVNDYFEALRKVDYQGWVTVEDFATKLPLAERTADNLSYLKGIEARVAAKPFDELCENPNDYMLGMLKK